MKAQLTLLLMACVGLAAAAADAPAPTVTINLGSREGHVTPCRDGFTHTGAGNIDVAQPSPDTIVVTMSGVAVAGGHPFKPSTANLNFDLNQDLQVTSSQPGPVKLTLEGRVIGALRSHRHSGGSAQEGPGQVSLMCGTTEVIGLATPGHAVKCGENLSVNCRTAPITLLATPGRVILHQTWSVSASHPQALFPCKAASTEFAPDPALDPLWISYWEPFHGVNKKDFGFQVTLRVSPTDAGGK